MVKLFVSVAPSFVIVAVSVIVWSPSKKVGLLTSPLLDMTVSSLDDQTMVVSLLPLFGSDKSFLTLLTAEFSLRIVSCNKSSFAAETASVAF